jgi:hypothetical protein
LESVFLHYMQVGTPPEKKEGEGGQPTLFVVGRLLVRMFPLKTQPILLHEYSQSNCNQRTFCGGPSIKMGRTVEPVRDHLV